MASPAINPNVPKSRSPLQIVCLILMVFVLLSKAFWLLSGISYVGLTHPMMHFAAALVCFIASTILLFTGNRNVGIALAWVGVILAFFGGQLGGVTPGPGHSRFEEQYRDHIFDYIFLVAADLQFWLRLKKERATAPPPDAR